MKFEDIEYIFNSNNNKWMTSTEVFNNFDKNGYKWTWNARGIQGHKNIIARDLSQRYRSKLEIDKNSKPQKYRLKNFDYDRRSGDEEVNSEVSIDIFLDNKDKDEYVELETESKEDDLIENIEEDKSYEFRLDVENLKFEEYNMPLKGKRKKQSKNIILIPKKFNYEKRLKINKIKGDLGEEAVIIMEKNKLIELGREDLAEDVKWESRDKGDGLGYDISSWENIDGEFRKIYIEVKTTTGDINTPFDISDKEVLVSKEFGDKYYIYRLFGVQKITTKINYYIINGDVENNFNLVPTSFKAYFKNRLI